ncbi:MAG: hypothetical protein ACI8R4_000597 [Paracoccaceae bacterium]|jgi:hypothetical protein
MTNPTTPSVTIAAGERGVLRLFALNMPAEQARFLAEPGAAAQMLGVAELDLDPDQIEVITLGDLDQMGLAGYLTQGFEIPADQIDRAALAALTGHILLLRSRAFRDQPATLKPAPQLTLIASYTEPQTNWHAAPIPDDTAQQAIARRAPPRAARSQARRIGSALFAVMMTLIALMLYLVIT